MEFPWMMHGVPQNNVSGRRAVPWVGHLPWQIKTRDKHMRKRACRVNTRLLITGREDAVYNEEMPERGIPDVASRAYGVRLLITRIKYAVFDRDCQKREFMSSQLRLTVPNMEF
jgi:hypothetical protein